MIFSIFLAINFLALIILYLKFKENIFLLPKYTNKNKVKYFKKIGLSRKNEFILKLNPSLKFNFNYNCNGELYISHSDNNEQSNYRIEKIFRGSELHKFFKSNHQHNDYLYKIKNTLIELNCEENIILVKTKFLEGKNFENLKDEIIETLLIFLRNLQEEIKKSDITDNNHTMNKDLANIIVCYVPFFYLSILLLLLYKLNSINIGYIVEYGKLYLITFCLLLTFSYINYKLIEKITNTSIKKNKYFFNSSLFTIALITFNIIQATVYINATYDKSKASDIIGIIEDKYTSKYKSTTNHKITIKNFGKYNHSQNVSVSKYGYYNLYQINDEIRLKVRTGSLSIMWVENFE